MIWAFSILVVVETQGSLLNEHHISDRSSFCVTFWWLICSFFAYFSCWNEHAVASSCGAVRSGICRILVRVYRVDDPTNNLGTVQDSCWVVFYLCVVVPPPCAKKSFSTTTFSNPRRRLRKVSKRNRRTYVRSPLRCISLCIIVIRDDGQG